MRFWNAFGYIDPRQAIEVAMATEAAGYHGLAVPDHSLYPQTLKSPYPYTSDGSLPFPPETPWPDVWCVLSAMAAVTRRIEFTTAVYVAPSRPLHVVAHQVATTAVLSENRVTLGVGVGWMQEEYDIHGQDFRTRGRRLDEMISALRELWKSGWVQFSGEFYEVPPCRMTPEPDHPIPIYVGGESEAARRRVATLSDGWILAGPMDIDAVQERMTDMRRRVSEAGRSIDDLRVIAMSPDAYNLDFYKALDELGVHDVIAVPWTDPTTSAATKVDDINRFGDEVIARAG